MKMIITRLKNLSYFALLAGAATFGATMAQGESANAFWSRQDSSSCYQEYSVDVGSGFIVNWINLNGCNTSFFSTSLFCPITDTSANPKTSITTLNVHMVGNGLSNSANRCVRFWNATGGSCGAASSSTASGSITLAPPTFANWTSSDFGYLKVNIAGDGSGTEACLQGYYSAG